MSGSVASSLKAVSVCRLTMEKPAETVQKTREQRRLQFRKLWRLRWLLRWIPGKRTLERFPVFKAFGKKLKTRKYLWSFKKDRVVPAILIGSVIAFLPIYGVQLPTVMAIALMMKINLPILAGLQFVSNPLTLVPIYLANYKVGSWILGWFGLTLAEANAIFFSMKSTVIGGAVLGMLFGLVVYGAYILRVKWEARTSEVAL